jgi:glycosyltransferase involved in cell wall biosynthesis
MPSSAVVSFSMSSMGIQKIDVGREHRRAEGDERLASDQEGARTAAGDGAEDVSFVVLRAFHGVKRTMRTAGAGLDPGATWPCMGRDVTNGTSEITLDVTRLVGRALKGRIPTGIDRVGLAYVAHFRDRGRAGAMVRLRGLPFVANAKSAERLFASVLGPPNRIALARAAASLVPDLSSRQGRLLIDTGHGALKHPNLLARWRAAGGRAVAFVHDLIPITHPELSRAGEADRHRIRMRAALEHCAGLIVNSHATLGELEAFANAESRRLPPSLVAHLGAPTQPPAASARPIESPYFVVVGTIEARKNHHLLLQLWRRLVAARGASAPKLVVLGQRGWEIEHVVDLLERNEAVRSAVIEKPDATDAELAAYVSHAQALLFPSLAEGYGLPLVEALTLGVPVVASDLPVFRELAADLPIYADPLDGPAWYAHVESLLDPASPIAADRRRAARDFHAPTWTAHFTKVDAFLESLR